MCDSRIPTFMKNKFSLSAQEYEYYMSIIFEKLSGCAGNKLLIIVLNISGEKVIPIKNVGDQKCQIFLRF